MYRSRHHPVLGTVVEIRIGLGGAPAGRADETARRIDTAAIDEMNRLEGVFSVFDPDSELERWKRGRVAPGPELTEVLALALDWHARSGGAFNVGARSLHDLWRRAEAADEQPTPAALREAVAAIAEPAYRVDDAGRVEPTGDVGGVDLNAIAKGWIVDRAADAAIGTAAEEGLDAATVDLVISAGGDLCHRGPGSVEVGIEHPLRPYDNEPPIARARLGGAALATSGGARRGFVIGGDRYSHLIDPRSGEPVDGVASISVIAPDAATADVVATIAAIEPPTAALTAAEQFGVTALVVTAEGDLLASAGWPAVTSD